MIDDDSEATPRHPTVSVGRTAELSALLFGTTELAHVVADVLRPVADVPEIDLTAARQAVSP